MILQLKKLFKILLKQVILLQVLNQQVQLCRKHKKQNHHHIAKVIAVVAVVVAVGVNLTEVVHGTMEVVDVVLVVVVIVN